MSWINQYVQPFIDNMMKQRYLVAIKEGILAGYPFLLVGSVLLLLAYPPIPFLSSYQNHLIILYELSVGLFGLYVTFSIGESLAKFYQMNQTQSGLFSVFTLLLSLYSTTHISLNILPYTLCVGILTTIITVEILRFSQKITTFHIFPDSIPSAVSPSFLSLVPLTLLFIFFGMILPMFPLIHHFIEIVKMILKIIDTLPMMLLIIFLITFFWSIGVHGATLISMILRPFWVCMLIYNGFVLIQGRTDFLISPEPFMQWFVWIGGSGTTLGLSFVMKYVSKSKHLREVGETSLMSSVFNINEPIIFGTPIVSNRIMMIPFIGVPMVCATMTWMAFAYRWIAPIRTMAVWTLPTPLGAFIATGLDLRAIIFNIILIVISALLYYPFVRVYDQQLMEEENNESILYRD